MNIKLALISIIHQTNIKFVFISKKINILILNKFIDKLY